MEVKASSSSLVHVGPGEGRALRMPGARLLTRKVSSEQTGGAYALFEVEVGSGGGEGPHVQHREDECFYVLGGHFGFVVEGEEIEAGPGSLIYVPKGGLHTFENAGDATGRILVSQTPGGAYERFVEELGEPVADGCTPTEEGSPGDPGRIAIVGAEYGLEMAPLP